MIGFVTSDCIGWDLIVCSLIIMEGHTGHSLILIAIFRTNLVRGPWNKEMKFQNKGAVLVQIAPLFIEIAPLFISQSHSQNQSICPRSPSRLHTSRARAKAVTHSCIVTRPQKSFYSCASSQDLTV